MACPNKNHPTWKNLVAKVGEYEAMSLYMRNDESTPSIGRDLKIPKSGIVSYQQKINILKRIRPYNTKLGTGHRVKFIPTGESYEGKREYTYVITIEENWKRNKDSQMALFQDKADQTKERNERIEDSMRVFLDTIGVDYQTVDQITDRDGNALGFAAKADMLNKVVEVVEDKAGIDTLPEEAAHFFVNILEAEGDPLYLSLYNNIDKYKVFDEVVENPNYQNYSEEMQRKEAIGKAIAKHIIGNDSDAELSDNLSRLQRWWIKLLNKIKKFFNKTVDDPYRTAALNMLNNEVNQNAAELITEEQIELGDLYQDSPQDKQADVKKLLDETETDLEMRLRDNEEIAATSKAILDLPEGKQTSMYYSRSRGSFVQGRVSHMAQEKLIKKKGKQWMREINQRPVNEHKRTQGTVHHSTMQNLVDFWRDYTGANKEAENRRLEAIKEAATNVEGLKIMTKEQFAILSTNVKKIIGEIKKQQKEIDPNGKADIRSEAMLYAPAEKRGLYYGDTAGTVDLLAVFSDGSASIYDWKFISPSQTAGFGQKRMIRETPFRSKEDGYNMQIGAYKNILQNFYRVKKVRRTRIVPVHVQYKWVGKSGEKTMSPVVDTLKMAYDLQVEDGKFVEVTGDPYLKQIPVADELTDKKGLDKILNQKIQERAVLKTKIETEKDAQKKQKLRIKLEKRDLAIKEMQRSGDLYNLIADAAATIVELEDRLPITDKEDVNYIQFDELEDFVRDISSGVLLIGDSTEYLKNLEDKELKDKLEDVMDRWAKPLNQMYDTLRDYRSLRIQELGESRGIKDVTRPQREYGFGKWFEQSSSSLHPIFQLARDHVERANNEARIKTKEVYEEIEVLRNDIKEKSGLGLQEAYDVMFNTETGNLHPRITKEFWERKKKAIEENDSNWMKRNYKLKSDAQKRYLERRKKFFAYVDRNFADYQALYKDQKLVTPRKSQKQMRDRLKAQWEAKNNIKQNSMWTGPEAYIYTELREETLNDNYSKEFKTIMNNPSLLAFYEYYQKKNREFSEITNMRFADNFVGNIHQDIIDSFSENGFGFKDLLTKSLESLEMRQDEITPESVDEHGNLIQTIPLLYTTPGTLIDPATGEINFRLKSRDLGKSLVAMAATVYNYAEKSKIEAINLSLLEYLQDSKTAILPTDSNDNLLMGKAGKIMEKIAPSDAADFFQRLYINFDLYGQRIQSKDQKWFGKYSRKKVLGGMKSLFSAQALGFAVVPALAAGVVGKISTWIESKKATSFTTKQLLAAEKSAITDKNKFNAVVNYFEIWQEDMTARRMLKSSAGIVSRWVNLDTLFAPFRIADNFLDNTILNAMMRNFGADANGMPKRLKYLPEGSKSLYELFEVSTEGPGNEGTVFTGLSKDGEVRFREMAQHITGGIKGSMRSDDVSPIDTTLIGDLVMHFKGWAPRLLQERFGKFRYSPKMDMYEWGRYKVAASEFMAEKDLESRLQTVTKTFAKWALETVTFGAVKGVKMNEENAEKEYHKFKMENPDDPDIQNMSKEEFYDSKRAQLRAMAAELKGLFGIFLAIFALTREGEDEKPIYTKTWATRKLMMVMMKAQLELGFALNPTDWTQMFRTPIPLTGLAVELQKSFFNFIQESNDLIMGNDNRRDKTPFGYYTFRMLPGFRQVSRMGEFYAQDKKNPYDR